jgi:hypothetical protein
MSCFSSPVQLWPLPSASKSLTSAGASLIVFLSLFFSNFAVSWIATIFLIDGSLKNAWGEQEQLEAERRGKAFMNGRA